MIDCKRDNEQRENSDHPSFITRSLQKEELSITQDKMAPPGSAHLNFTLGGLVMVGGVMGYMKKGS
jgi:hypothetical protein